MYTRFFLPS
jgi:zinc transporter 7